MNQGDASPVNHLSCSACAKAVPGYDSISYGSLEKGYRLLCTECFNREVADLDGLEKFQHVNFMPVKVADCGGENHEFHFRVRLLGAEVALDAFELFDGEPSGYQFQMIGDAEGDLLALLGRLIERIRRVLSSKYLEHKNFGQQIANQVVRGRIDWDRTNDEPVPLMIVDGREVSWDEFGRMLMSFEGFQFELNIRDKSEEF